MKRKILQSIGNSIIKGLEKCNEPELIKAYYEMGIWFDGICIRYFKVYLD